MEREAPLFARRYDAAPPADTSSLHPLLLSRGRGLLLGQLCGDSLGSLVEFRTQDDIARQYPHGVRDMASGGYWGLLPGQPTDDSELALLLARGLASMGAYDEEWAADGYAYWYATGPFDMGTNTRLTLGPAYHAWRHGASAANAARTAALSRQASAANGALMRISPLALYARRFDDGEQAELARRDAALTHANILCQEANALYVVALCAALNGARDGQEILERAVAFGRSRHVPAELLDTLTQARRTPPATYDLHMGWVLIAFHNAFFQLLHAVNAEEGIVDTVGHGGDTDTNACIAGALLGAHWGMEALPIRWREAVLSCRADAEKPGVTNPRPAVFWPDDAIELADRLLTLP